jgi:D-galactarolactone cycloisomerase
MGDKIRAFEVVTLTGTYVRPDTAANHKANGLRNCVWLRLETESGLVGWGEAYWGAYATEVTAAALRRYRSSLLGADISDPEAATEHARFRNRYWTMRGIGAHASSAIEAAIWDIFAQAAGVPLWKLLGDGVGRPVLAYASAGDTSMSPAEIYAQVTRLTGMGYRAYKLRCGGELGKDDQAQLEWDVERVRAAREALGRDRLLLVDVTVPQRKVLWTEERAQTYMERLEPFGLFLLEEPAPTYDLERYRSLQATGRIAVAGGESFTSPEEFEPFFAARAYGVVQPDATVVGGPVSCAAVCRRAHELGVPVAIHAWSAGVGLAQNMQVAFGSPAAELIEWPQARYDLATEPIRPIFRMVDGYLQPPEAPGLGVSVSPELIEAHTLRPDSERNF